MAHETDDRAADLLHLLSNFDVFRAIWSRSKKIVVLDVEGNEEVEAMSFLVLVGVAAMTWKDDKTWEAYRRLREERGLPVPNRPTDIEDAMFLLLNKATGLI